MLSAAGGRTPEVWNFPYANPHHGSLVNGDGRESLAEEGELLPRQGCTQPAMQRRLCATAHGYAVWPLSGLRQTAVQLPPCGSHYT